MKTIWLSVLVLLVFCGCDSPKTHHYQRFLPFSSPLGIADKSHMPAVPAYAVLALDTKTGSLCVTYKFGIDLDYPQFKNLPECKDLYEKDPE